MYSEECYLLIAGVDEGLVIPVIHLISHLEEKQEGGKLENWSEIGGEGGRRRENISRRRRRSREMQIRKLDWEQEAEKVINKILTKSWEAF